MSGLATNKKRDYTAVHHAGFSLSTFLTFTEIKTGPATRLHGCAPCGGRRQHLDLAFLCWREPRKAGSRHELGGDAAAFGCTGK